MQNDGPIPNFDVNTTKIAPTKLWVWLPNPQTRRPPTHWTEAGLRRPAAPRGSGALRPGLRFF